jgi:hypothetical protein
MRILFTIFIAILAFAAGVWYMGGFESIPQIPSTPNPNITVTTTPSTNTPTTTNQVPAAQVTYKNADATRIQVTTPTPGASVPSTFTVTGKAVGGWYFEANFPYEVWDANGTKIAEGPVQAQGEWMTPAFVPFTFQVTISGYKGKATLILHNDNPSGLPENAASLTIPITIQ